MAEPMIPWLVWILPLIGAMLTPFVAKMGAKVRDYVAVAFSFLAAVFAASLIPTALAGEVVHSQVEWIPTLHITAGVLADPLSILMANVVAWISFLIMVYSIGYMKGEANLTRYWFFMNFFIANMLLIVLSDNFLQLFFGWEGVGLASYALIGFWHTDEKERWVGKLGHQAWKLPQTYSPSHAGMKALVTTRVGDIAFLIGILMLFAFAGTFDYGKLAADTSWARELAALGLLAPVAILIFGGAIGKSAQFPLHVWLPDAMAGPTAVSALIHAATMVKAGVFLVARVAPIFVVAAGSIGLIMPFFETVAWVGAFTAFLAATQAMVSKEVKKVLAYSTVSQIGFMMLALGVAGLSGDFAAGYTAGFFHLTSHAIFKAALFMGAGTLLHATKTKYMDEMGGLRGEMKITFVAMVIAAASLSGIPPLSGFWSKDSILGAVLPVSSPLFIIAVVTSLITVFYSFRMIGLIFFGAKSQHLERLQEGGHHVHEAPAVMWVPYSILAAATVGMGFAGLFLEGLLRDTLGGYVEHFYHVPTLHAHEVISIPAVMSSLVVIGIGGFLGYYFYISRRGDPARIIESNIVLKNLYKFLENRWYINALYYKIFVDGILYSSIGLFKRLEKGFIDRSSDAAASGSIFAAAAGNKFDVHVVDAVVNGSAGAGQKFSSLLRKIQTGIAEQYAFAFAVGIGLLIIVMFLL
uniref:NADH-ubiquinone oxidoreductase subunit L (NuoL) n=1 Tax=uncultured marine thaumarchaeote KM3_55_F05 TaxID=1456198 RepID=A0A075HER9_9ARCH|nr:NADH-ubiquinone oxidoreductase subunit L (nuoL) [uncultured marine thaumarchaeote KM3_55_F05]